MSTDKPLKRQHYTSTLEKRSLSTNSAIPISRLVESAKAIPTVFVLNFAAAEPEGPKKQRAEHRVVHQGSTLTRRGC